MFDFCALKAKFIFCDCHIHFFKAECLHLRLPRVLFQNSRRAPSVMFVQRCFCLTVHISVNFHGLKKLYQENVVHLCIISPYFQKGFFNSCGNPLWKFSYDNPDYGAGSWRECLPASGRARKREDSKAQENPPTCSRWSFQGLFYIF